MLDQPEKFTNEGKTEQVLRERPLNENNPEKNQDRLLTEDPLAGVEIILN